MSGGPAGAPPQPGTASYSHDNHPAVPESIGYLKVARIWSACGPGGMKDTDWYVELESLSETVTCKVLLIKDLEHVKQGKKRPREVVGTEEGGAESMVPIAEELVLPSLLGAQEQMENLLERKEELSMSAAAEQAGIVEAEVAEQEDMGKTKASWSFKLASRRVFQYRLCRR